MEHLEVLFSARWPTLGRAVHYYHHLDYRPPSRSVPLPLPPSRYAITPAGTPAEDFPPPDLVDAIDKRAGVFDEDNEQAARLGRALRGLREYDPVMARVVQALCISGRVQLIPGSRVRHYSQDVIIEEPPFEGDARLLSDWLTKAWEGLGLLLATPAQLDAALRTGATDKTVLRDFQKMGLLQTK